MANRLTQAITGTGRKIAAGARWLLQHEPALTMAVAGAVANAVYAGLNDDLTRDQLFRSAALAALGVLVRMKVSSPATAATLEADVARLEGQRDRTLEGLAAAHDELHDVRNQLHAAKLNAGDPLPPPGQ